MSDVQNIKLDRLLPDPENINQHNSLNIAQIKASITRFGFLDPIGVVAHITRRGYHTIVEGHGRYDAASELGMSEVPCLVLTLDEAHRKGYAIAHNQTQQISPMDHRAVAGEFERLEVSADDYVSLGYTAEDVLFLPGMGDGPGGNHPHYHAAPGEEGESGSGGERDNEQDSGGGAGHFVPTVHRTSLSFASDTSYNRFVHILTQLRGRYPTAATIGERLVLLMKDMGAETPA